MGEELALHSYHQHLPFSFSWHLVPKLPGFTTTVRRASPCVGSSDVCPQVRQKGRVCVLPRSPGLPWSALQPVTAQHLPAFSWSERSSETDWTPVFLLFLLQLGGKGSPGVEKAADGGQMNISVHQESSLSLCHGSKKRHASLDATVYFQHLLVTEHYFLSQIGHLFLLLMS